MSEAPDAYDSSDGDDYFGGVCKICYEDIMRELADKWDRENSEKCDWTNPYRIEED